MVATLAAMAVLSTAPIVALPTAVWPLAPEAKVRADGEPLVIKATKPRAVLLIHGLLLRPIRTDKLVRPELHDWQQVKSELVKALAADADVYAFGYAQTVPVDVVSLSPGFIGIVEKLRKAGYKEIVLLGHSAGGLIARHFVERFPEAGVTKVIQVASPNAGSDLANIPIGIPRLQQGFVKSLAPRARQGAIVEKLPAGLAFCCVVCKVRSMSGDTMVGLESQWSVDLRNQGVPATLVAVNHFDAMKAPQAVGVIAELAREPLVRWDTEQVELGRQIVFGKEADAAAAKRAASKLRLFGKGM